MTLEKREGNTLNNTRANMIYTPFKTGRENLEQI